MAATYNLPLVLLSISFAFLVSYTAVDLALRMMSMSSNRRTRALWHIGGTFSMGIGIWGMHFTGMLAFELPVTVTYDALVIFVSWLLVIIASMTVLRVLSRGDKAWMFGLVVP